MNSRQQNIVKSVTVAGVIFLLIMLIGLISNLITVASLRAQRRSLQRELDALAGSNAAMQQEVSYKSTDIYVEQYARAMLDMIKEGERIVIISGN